jgi:hypothetical protein
MSGIIPSIKMTIPFYQTHTYANILYFNALYLIMSSWAKLVASPSSANSTSPSKGKRLSKAQRRRLKKAKSRTPSPSPSVSSNESVGPHPIIQEFFDNRMNFEQMNIAVKNRELDWNDVALSFEQMNALNISWADVCCVDDHLTAGKIPLDLSLLEEGDEDAYDVTVELEDGEVEEHPLGEDWTFWYHSINERDWSLYGYKRLATVHSIEEFNKALSLIPSEFSTGGFIWLMRGKVKPQWEDPANREGGFQSFLCPKKSTFPCFTTAARGIVEGTLVPQEQMDKIVGLACTIKKQRKPRNDRWAHTAPQKQFLSKTFDVIKFWMTENTGKLELNDQWIGCMPAKERVEGLVYKRHQDK